MFSCQVDEQSCWWNLADFSRLPESLDCSSFWLCFFFSSFLQLPRNWNLSLFFFFSFLIIDFVGETYLKQACCWCYGWYILLWFKPFYSAHSYIFWIGILYSVVTNIFLILGKVCFVVSSAALPWKQTEKNYIRQLQYLR